MAKLAGICLALGSLLLSPLLGAIPARAEYTSPSRVTGIEEARSTSFGGAAFVRLATVRCAFRPDGFFVLPNDPKQHQMLDLLLTAQVNNLRVVVNFVPPTCDLATVGLCPRTGAC